MYVFSYINCFYSKVKVAQSCLTLRPPWTVAHQASLSMGFSDKNTGVGSCPLLQGIFPTQVSNPGLLHCSHCRWLFTIQATRHPLFFLPSSIGYNSQITYREICPLLRDRETLGQCFPFQVIVSRRE